MRERPLRERKPKKKIEDDPEVLRKTAAILPIPDGTKEFRNGYRECVELYALHAPNRRAVRRILEEHCITLEDECLREGMMRENIAQYEGFRQAIKDLLKMKKMR